MKAAQQLYKQHIHAKVQDVRPSCARQVVYAEQPTLAGHDVDKIARREVSKLPPRPLDHIPPLSKDRGQ